MLRLNLSSVAGRLGKILKYRVSGLIPREGGDKNVQKRAFSLRFHADSRKKCRRLLKTAFYYKKSTRKKGGLAPPPATPPDISIILVE